MDYDQALLAACLNREGDSATRSGAGLKVGQAGLDVLRVDLAATYDQDCLQATSDEQFRISEEAEVAGAQVWARTVGQSSAEDFFGERWLLPVAGGDAGTADPHFANLAGCTWDERNRIDDEQRLVVDALAAADNIAAFFKFDNYRRISNQTAGDHQRRFGQAITRIERRLPARSR